MSKILDPYIIKQYPLENQIATLQLTIKIFPHTSIFFFCSLWKQTVPRGHLILHKGIYKEK